MNLKEAYVKQRRERVDLWVAEIDKLKAKADEAGAEARIAYLVEIKALRSKQEAAKLRLREVSEAGEGAYKDLKAGARRANVARAQLAGSAGALARPTGRRRA